MMHKNYRSNMQKHAILDIFDYDFHKFNSGNMNKSPRQIQTRDMRFTCPIQVNKTIKT